MAELSQRDQSPYSLREKLARLAWGVVEPTLFRLSFRTWYRYRGWLLRRFGARIDPTARVHRTVRIECPWNLSIGPDSAVGESAILYCLGPVTIGARVTVSQYAHLCAGTHDYTSLQMPLVRPPIIVGDDAWIGADAFVGPSVTIADGVILGARSSAFRSLPARTVCVGNPARPVKQRELR